MVFCEHLSFRFNDAQLESKFRRIQNLRLSGHDVYLYLASSFFWLAGALWLAQVDGVSDGVRHGVKGAVLWLMPWLVHKLAPDTYLRHRTACVTGLRLGCLLLPSLADRFAHLPPGEQLRPSLNSLLSTITLGAQVIEGWSLGVVLRLDWGIHLLLHTLLAGRLVILQAPRLCLTPCINNPITLPRFSAVTSFLTELSWLLIPSFDAHAAADPAEAPGPQHCYTLIVVAHLLLGYLLPTVAVYIAERRSRAEFLAAEAGASGVQVLEAAFRGRLGLPAHEGLHACMFDSLAAWVLCAALLPAVAALVWLVVLSLSYHWAGAAAAAAV